MENNPKQPTDKLTNEEMHSLLLWLSVIVCAVFVVGALTGGAITSLSYGKAYLQGDIHVCSKGEIDYQKAIFELEKCQNANKNKLNYEMPVNGTLFT